MASKKIEKKILSNATEKVVEVKSKISTEKIPLVNKEIDINVEHDNNANYALKMINIHKSFLNGAIKANVGINLFVKSNSIHAIIGENGAGKSTLMSILFGMYEPDEGEIWIRNEKVEFKSSKDATKHNIGMVHQHFKLVENFTVLENIILGAESSNSLGIMNKNKDKEKIENLIRLYGFDLDVNKKISQLTVGQQQKVEILKVLFRDSDIIIFDEPSAVLSDKEIQSFLQMVKKFKEDGKTIIIITHKLHEVKEVASEATIIRKGKFIQTIDVTKTDVDKMAELMVGRKIIPSVNTLPCERKEVVLEVNNLITTFVPLIEYRFKQAETYIKNIFSILKDQIKIKFSILNEQTKNNFLILKDQVKNKIKGNTEETKIINDNARQVRKIKSNNEQIKHVNFFKRPEENLPMVSFKVHAGEIYAIAGIEGSGQSDIAEYIAGLKKSNPQSVIFLNEDISNFNVRERIKKGISHVPEDRHKHGLDLEADCRVNAVQNTISEKPYSNYGFMVEFEIADHANTIIQKYDIRGTANGTSLAKSLSGGNQQKVIIGREIEKQHKLIVMVQPTRGLDVGAIEFIHKQIISEKEKGNAILLISYELDEILALADTIAVVSKKRIIKEGPKDIMTREVIGNLLAGERL